MSAFHLFSVIIILFSAALTFARPHLQVSEGIRWSSIKNASDATGAEACRTGNPIDDCWRCDPNWESNRRMLADCAVGFGRNAIGGRDGEIYVVTNSEDDDPKNPSPGTLRYAVIQDEPLWITFDRDMVITLKDELIMNSYKTIDGRGADVAIASGPCITIQSVTNIIIHGIYVHNCVPSIANSTVIDGPDHYELRGAADGDGISIFAGRDIWIDHCTLTNCKDGLIDVVYGSTAITISNNYMFDHNEVMLLGHHDDFLPDKAMQVTIAFNYFGEGLVQRIPRCRHGYFHIVNNVYTAWKMYAVGGSASPTINSQGNLFIASDNNFAKEITKRDNTKGYQEWKDWNWRSVGDVMENGAYFRTSGQQTPQSYAKASSLVARPASEITKMVPTAGVLDCKIGQHC